MFADHRIDLAHRRGDGIDVVLWWSPEDDSVAVEVLHLASDSSFELSVERSRALDAFYHPSPTPPGAAPSSWTSLRREPRAAGGLVFGPLGFFLGFVYRGDLLVAPFVAAGAALLH